MCVCVCEGREGGSRFVGREEVRSKGRGSERGKREGVCSERWGKHEQTSTVRALPDYYKLNLYATN